MGYAVYNGIKEKYYSGGLLFIPLNLALNSFFTFFCPFNQASKIHTWTKNLRRKKERKKAREERKFSTYK